MAIDRGNVERLEAAGVIINTPLPDPYESVIGELDEDDVEAIIRLKKRLDEAEADAKLSYKSYFVPF